MDLGILFRVGYIMFSVLKYLIYVRCQIIISLLLQRLKGRFCRYKNKKTHEAYFNAVIWSYYNHKMEINQDGGWSLFKSKYLQLESSIFTIFYRPMNQARRELSRVFTSVLQIHWWYCWSVKTKYYLNIRRQMENIIIAFYHGKVQDGQQFCVTVSKFFFDILVHGALMSQGMNWCQLQWTVNYVSRVHFFFASLIQFYQKIFPIICGFILSSNQPVLYILL